MHLDSKYSNTEQLIDVAALHGFLSEITKDAIDSYERNKVFLFRRICRGTKRWQVNHDSRVITSVCALLHAVNVSGASGSLRCGGGFNKEVQTHEFLSLVTFWES